MNIETGFLVSTNPPDFPGLVSFWRFRQPGTEFPAVAGESYTLKSRTGVLDVVSDPRAPFGGMALNLAEGDFLAIPRSACPRLDINGRDGRLTVIAWIKRRSTATRHCEFIAGQWNETDRGRQYGLFLNIVVWNTPDTVCGHLSLTGGATPGFKYCMDGAFGATKVPHDQWSVVAMSYDGSQGYAWLDGRLDAQPMLNPYSLSGGLHDGGPNGSDFTVGAVHRSGEYGNFFTGLLSGLAVYDRALTPAEIAALALAGRS